MSQLDHDDGELLEALRDDLPSPDRKDAVRARLLAAGALGVTTMSGLAAAQTPALAAIKHAGGFALSKLLGFGVGLIALGSVAVFTLSSSLRHSPEPVALPVVSASTAKPQRIAPSPEPEVTSLPAQLAPLVESRREPLRARRAAARALTSEPAAEPPSTPGDTGPTSPSTLGAESELLGKAAQALHAGRNVEAAALLDEHAQRFPNGLLTRERELARQRLDEASQRDEER